MSQPDQTGFPFDPNHPGSKVEIVVRCARCARKLGDRAAHPFGKLVYGGHARDVDGSYRLRPLRGIDRRVEVGWVWLAFTNRRAVRGQKQQRHRLQDFANADAAGLQLECPRCGAAPRVRTATMEERAHEAATRGVASIFI